VAPTDVADIVAGIEERGAGGINDVLHGGLKGHQGFRVLVRDGLRFGKVLESFGQGGLFIGGGGGGGGGGGEEEGTDPFPVHANGHSCEEGCTDGKGGRGVHSTCALFLCPVRGSTRIKRSTTWTIDIDSKIYRYCSLYSPGTVLISAGCTRVQA
jgi:hypothetical protein